MGVISGLEAGSEAVKIAIFCKLRILKILPAPISFKGAINVSIAICEISIKIPDIALLKLTSTAMSSNFGNQFFNWYCWICKINPKELMSKMRTKNMLPMSRKMLHPVETAGESMNLLY